MELLEHEIVVDKYTKITLSIPKQLDASELKALMLKANKIFSVSEIEIQSRTGEKTKVSPSSVWHWTPEQNAFVENKVKEGLKAIQIIPLFHKKFGIEIPYKKLYPKVFDFKKR